MVVIVSNYRNAVFAFQSSVFVAARISNEWLTLETNPFDRSIIKRNRILRPEEYHDRRVTQIDDSKVSV